MSLEGKTLGTIRIVEQLGVGGMGRVYLGVDELLGRKVAVKLVRGERLPESSNARVRFLREARLLSQLEHPNICRLYEFLTVDEHELIVLELAHGATLDERLRSGGLSASARLAIAVQVADALVAAHALSVVHRDLKPGNIMVGEDGTVKVLDFGLARLVEPGELEEGGGGSLPEMDDGETAPGDVDSDAVTRLGDVLGTPRYMSPEQARGEPVTAASDMYSFGLVLQELLTGTPAHARNLPVEVVRQRAMWGETEPVGGADRDTRRLVERLKALQPGQRPSAVETAEQLRFIQARPRRRLRRVAIGVVAACLVLAAVASSLGFWHARRSLAVAREAEALADREAATAREVSDFLISVFRVSDPGEARGGTVTAREILDNGAARVERELAGQPLTQARLMAAIGLVCHYLGLDDRARPLLERSLAIRTEQLGPDHLDVAESLTYLGHLARQQGDLATAEERYRRALAIREAALGADHSDVAASLNLVAVVAWDRGRYAEAEPLYRRVLASWEGTFGPDHPKVATVLNNLGLLYWSQGRFADAEPFFTRALAIRECSLGPDHPETGDSVNNLAILYLDQERYREAEPLYRRNLALQERLFGHEHRAVASASTNLAIFFARQGRYDEAEPLYRQALAIQEKILGPEHPDVAMSLHNMAVLSSRRGQRQAAVPLLERAIAIAERSLGPEHPLLALSLSELANARRDQGRSEEAERLYRRALAIQERALSPDSPDLAETRAGYAELLRTLGRDQEAAALTAKVAVAGG